MSKPKDLWEHLQDSSFQDPASRITTGPVAHLGVQRGVFEGGWKTVAEWISGLERWNAIWFPDTMVIRREEQLAVIDAFRVAGLGVLKGSARLTPAVEAELQEWLNDPRDNQKSAKDIRTAIEQETWLKRFGLKASDPLLPAVYGYAHLIGFRRFLARPLEDGKTLMGTDPNDKQGTMNAIIKNLGGRAGQIAKKGRQYAEKTKTININDEINCFLTIIHALQHRRDSFLLTADRDLIEIFFKSQWFIDTHYRAWLVANMIKQGRYGDPVRELNETKGYFEGPIVLYRRPTMDLHEVLPRFRQPVRTGVVYVDPDETVQCLRITLDVQMLEMIKTRGLTGGLCSSLFSPNNVHVALGPLNHTLKVPFLGIGLDNVVELGAEGTKSRVSRLDLEHSINCLERHGAGRQRGTYA